VSLQAALSSALAGRVAVLGIGNRLRGDDGAGSELASALQGADVGWVFDGEEVPETMVGAIAAAAPDTVLLVDAVELQAAPGSVALLEPDQTASYLPTTHRVPAGLLMEIIERVTAARCLLLGVQPGAIGLGQPMTPPVRAAVEELAELLAGVLAPGATPSSAGPGDTEVP
jgi:hydrogenase 3 maturation protease